MATPTPQAVDHKPGLSGPRRLDGSFEALLDYLWVTERKNSVRRKIPKEKRPRLEANRRLEMRLKASIKNYSFEESLTDPLRPTAGTGAFSTARSHRTENLTDPNQFPGS